MTKPARDPHRIRRVGMPTYLRAAAAPRHPRPGDPHQPAAALPVDRGRPCVTMSERRVYDDDDEGYSLLSSLTFGEVAPSVTSTSPSAKIVGRVQRFRASSCGGGGYKGVSMVGHVFSPRDQELDPIKPPNACEQAMFGTLQSSLPAARLSTRNGVVSRFESNSFVACASIELTIHSPHSPAIHSPAIHSMSRSVCPAACPIRPPPSPGHLSASRGGARSRRA